LRGVQRGPFDIAAGPWSDTCSSQPRAIHS
jgi:hypothetical protein